MIWRRKNSSAPDWKQKIGILLPGLALVAGLLATPRMARANSGNSFWETIGISIAVGTVLGASTLPFYDQPGEHVLNTGLGATAGVLTGVGILVYGLFQGKSSESLESAGIFPPGQPLPRSCAFVPVHLTSYWMPLVSVTW